MVEVWVYVENYIVLFCVIKCNLVFICFLKILCNLIMIFYILFYFDKFRNINISFISFLV